MNIKSIHTLLVENTSVLLKSNKGKLVAYNDEYIVDLAGDDSIVRRIVHTLKWCEENQANHCYDQMIFDTSDDPSHIGFRLFEFSILNEGIKVSISNLDDFPNSMTSKSFESSLFDSISDAILITEADPVDLPGPRIVYCNKAFSDMTGYAKSDVLGRSPRILQGEGTKLQARKNIASNLLEWKRVKQKMINYRSNGTVFEVELNIAPVSDATGWFSHWISVQRELSAHKDIIDYFHQSNFILNASNTASWYFNFSEDSLYWDERMFHMHNLISDSFKIDYLDWFASIHKDDRHMLYKSIENARHSQRELDVSYRVIGDDGRVRWLRIRAEIMKYQQEMRILCGICFDITEEKDALEKIENHRLKAEQNAKLASLGELAAGVGHEINNPLAVIVANIDLLELQNENGAKLPQTYGKAVRQMREASERIAKIVNGLKNVSSVTREFDHISVANLSSDIEKTIEMLKDLFASDNVNITFTPACAQDSYIKIDPAGLQQVVINLVSNAKDAVANQNFKLIELSIENRTNTCCLHVKDNGTGIDEGIKERIFEPFATTKDIGKGTGLGLSICKSIVESCGGRIKFSSSEHQGTCFTCEFLSAYPQHTIVNDKDEDITLSSANVLLVDDDLQVAQSLSSVLASFGCNVMHKQNGQEALLWLRDNEIDLLLTDLKMPVVDGRELLESIEKRGIAKNAHKFIMTGNVLTHSDKNQFSLTALTDGILQKPIRRIEIAKILNQLG